MFASIAARIARTTNESVGRAVYGRLQEIGLSGIVNAVGGTGSPIGSALRNVLLRAAAHEAVAGDEQTPMQRLRNKAAHRAWLEQNRWRFDWRSQPRRPAGTSEGGEWMEGRLDYMAEAKAPISRSKRQRATRSIKAYKARQRAAGNLNTRTIRTSWGDF